MPASLRSNLYSHQTGILYSHRRNTHVGAIQYAPLGFSPISTGLLGAVLYCHMAKLSFALYQAHANGFSVECLSERLSLPAEFVAERIETARLCIILR
jgi:hypothetical protein